MLTQIAWTSFGPLLALCKPKQSYDYMHIALTDSQQTLTKYIISSCILNTICLRGHCGCYCCMPLHLTSQKWYRHGPLCFSSYRPLGGEVEEYPLIMESYHCKLFHLYINGCHVSIRLFSTIRIMLMRF